MSETMTPAEITFQAFARAMAAITAGMFESVRSELSIADVHSREALSLVGFYLVPEFRLEELEKKLARFAKRCAKLGKPNPIGYRVIGQEIQNRAREGRDGSVYHYTMAFALVELTGEPPLVNGSRLLARIEHTEAGNIVACAPGVESRPEWRELDTRCEHCRTKRNRIDTFVVETPDGVSVVGRNCLADFVRSADAADAVQMWKFISELSASCGASDSDWSSYGGGYYIETYRFMACALRACRKYGYVKRGSREQSTVDAASFACGKRPSTGDSMKVWDESQPEQVDYQAATETLTWLLGDLDEREMASDFIQNCRVVAQLPCLKEKQLGLAAAAGWSYLKKTERAIARARAQRATAEHFGEVGKRYDVASLTVTRVHVTYGDYGPTTIVALDDGAGHPMTWFASGEKEFRAGEIYRGKITVKKHATDRYTNKPVTIVTRCALEKVEQNGVAA